MADKVSQRPVWVTIVAAVATVVVILGIAAGPTVVGCATSDSGLGACMRERMADIGLLRQGPAVVSAPIEEAAQTAKPIPAAELEMVKPESESEPEATTEIAEPRLGLVRAEPDGSLVIAGSAEPGAEVEIYANGVLLDTAVAESSGDWVLIPDAPLPPGGVEIAVGVPATGQFGKQSVVVVIQDDLTTEPLVVASTPGQASDILQGLEVPQEPMEVASAEPVVEPVAEPAAPIALAPPTIDAIEVDGDRNYFAGSGANGATVRLYIDSGFIADAIVAGGRWLIETPQNYLTLPSQRVRIDMLRPGTAEVAARAEVNFELDMPTIEAEQPVAVATAPATEIQPTDAINQAAADNASSALASAPQIDVTTPAAQSQMEVAAVAEPASEPAPVSKPSAPTPPAVMTKTEQQTDVASALATDNATPEVPTLTAVSVGDQRFASGKAIIRQGDNLWSIASRVYGSGYRFITIYRANREQILNPDLIFPGQVFDLPEVEAVSE